MLLLHATLEFVVVGFCTSSQNLVTSCFFYPNCIIDAKSNSSHSQQNYPVLLKRYTNDEITMWANKIIPLTAWRMGLQNYLSPSFRAHPCQLSVSVFASLSCQTPEKNRSLALYFTFFVTWNPEFFRFRDTPHHWFFFSWGVTNVDPTGSSACKVGWRILTYSEERLSFMHLFINCIACKIWDGHSNKTITLYFHGSWMFILDRSVKKRYEVYQCRFAL